MPIFASRSIENALLRLGRVLPERKVRDLLSKMKAGERSAISTEWEIVLLEAFDRLGVIAHESETIGGTRPDLWFSDSWTRFPSFVAEIKAVFPQNAAFHEYKDYFFKELTTVINKAGFTLEGFSFHVEQYAIDGVLHCCAPAQADVSAYLHSRVLRDLIDARRGGRRTFTLQFFDREKNYNFTLQFDAGEKSFRFHFPPDTEKDNPKRIQDHVVWKALERARSQLKRTPDGVLKAAILCDAGCNYLREKPRGWRGWDEKGYRDFLAKRGGLDFILIVTTEQKNDPHEFRRRYTPKARDCVKVRAIALDPDLEVVLEEECERLAGEFPDVVLHPSNAEQNVRPSWFWGPRIDHIGRCLWGSSRTEGRYALISADGLMKVLAGELPPDMLFDHDIGNPVKRAVDEDLYLEVINLVATRDSDDDLVALRMRPKVVSVESKALAEKSVRRMQKLRQRDQR